MLKGNYEVLGYAQFMLGLRFVTLSFPLRPEDVSPLPF